MGEPNRLLVHVTVSVIALLLLAYLSFYSPTDDFHIQVFFLFSLECMLFVYPDDIYDDYLASLLQKFDSRQRFFSFFGNFKIGFSRILCRGGFGTIGRRTRRSKLDAAQEVVLLLPSSNSTTIPLLVMPPITRIATNQLYFPCAIRNYLSYYSV